MEHSIEQKIEQLHQKYTILSGYLNEKGRRIWAATEAKSQGYGGIALISKATGITYKTIKRGLLELEKTSLPIDGIRSKGGGRKRNVEKDITLQTDLDNLVGSSTRGDPETPLLWSSKSTYKLADELRASGHKISQKSVYSLLSEMGYTLQSNRKTEEGGTHPDRDAQFQFITDKTKAFQKNGQPVISVDTKKKENIGNFKNNGRDYHQKGQAPKVNVYDFIDKEKGKVSPYGVYDLAKNKGWVSVGVSHDTAQFAVNGIRSWWYEMGKETYLNATKLYINADGGGSNGWRTRLWKTELQKLATEFQLTLHVSHFPPGTSKWNKIEHRMFSFISQNWRGRPLIDSASVVNLIANTKTKSGLQIRAKLDERSYQKGIKISDEELASVSLKKEKFHGEWNYKILPK